MSLKSVYGAIDVLLEGFTKDLATLENLPEFSFEAKEVYKSTLNINEALNQGRKLAEMAKRKAEAERLAAERKAEQERQKDEAEAKKQEEKITANVTVVVETPEGQRIPLETIPVEVPARQWVSFKALLNVEEAGKLKDFFENNDIMIEAI